MKATDSLLADHKMIRKLWGELQFDNPRFDEIALTLHRVILGHAWFEDQIFLPALKNKELLVKCFADEIQNEHHDINTLLGLVRKTPKKEAAERAAYRLQLVTLLDTHFKKEEDALFPLAEKILDLEGLNRLSDEMKARQAETRGLLRD
jgi:iron-sulfur cluster repair protein YtfE (RIC family)